MNYPQANGRSARTTDDGCDNRGYNLTTPGALATPEPGALPTSRSRLMSSLAYPGCPEPTDNQKSTHPRRVIPAPPDGCPECLIRDNHPVVSWYEGRGDDLSIVGAYQCQSCGHIWRCGWLVRAL